MKRARAIPNDKSKIVRPKSRIAGGRGGLKSRIPFGQALITAGRTAEGLAALQEAVALWPGSAGAALALGEGLMALGDLPTAIAEFQRAVALGPNSAAARYALGGAWLAAGEAETAIEILTPIMNSRSLYRDRAKERISEAEAIRRLGRSAPDYLRHLFDQFAAHYDESMVGQLRYRAPAILRELAGLLRIGNGRALDILDLGCGTGLAGEAFRRLAWRMDGVDLSPRMITVAAERKIYGDLAVADLESWLAETHGQYDLALAADVLVYFGELSRLFHGVRRHLRPNGDFLFTVERWEGPGYEWGPRRRYRHSESYLRREAKKAGFDCNAMLECTLRIEAGSPVIGLALALRKA